MAFLTNKWLWIALLGAVLSGSLLLVVIGYIGLLVYSGLVSGTPVVSLLLEIALPALVSIAVLVSLLTLSTVGAIWVVVQSVSVPRNERIATLIDRLEREYSPLPPTGFAEWVRPPEPSADERAEQALAELKQQYVDGEITEREFERKVDRLVTTDSIDEPRAARERRHVSEREPERE